MTEKETNQLSIIRQININEYDYPLPDERIAKFPLPERDQSKLLLYSNGEVSESQFNRLPDLLPEKSLIVFNNTRVIQARLLFTKETGTPIEIFCLEPDTPRDYALNFQSCGQCRWNCLIGNAKRWKGDTLKRKLYINNNVVILTAERLQTNGQTHVIQFQWDNPDHTFAAMLDAAGVIPIPPYLHRKTEASDLHTYQTVYSKIKGSVAAPTAGLHFTKEVLNELDRKGFKREELTLHVGAGTFKPVQTDIIGEHEMHAEYLSVNRSTIASLIDFTGRITAVGTTSMRTLESLYFIGATLAANQDESLAANQDISLALIQFAPAANPNSSPAANPNTSLAANPRTSPAANLCTSAEMLFVKQWTPYENRLPLIPAKEALLHILYYLDKNKLDKLTASTQIMIAPGYRFHIVNNLITNFHQPKSTLLLLVSAFVKGDWRKMYDYALNRNFRFLSYGDCSLLTGGK